MCNWKLHRTLSHRQLQEMISKLELCRKSEFIMQVQRSGYQFFNYYYWLEKSASIPSVSVSITYCFRKWKNKAKSTVRVHDPWALWRHSLFSSPPVSSRWLRDGSHGIYDADHFWRRVEFEFIRLLSSALRINSGVGPAPSTPPLLFVSFFFECQALVQRHPLESIILADDWAITDRLSACVLWPVGHLSVILIGYLNWKWNQQELLFYKLFLWIC